MNASLILRATGLAALLVIGGACTVKHTYTKPGYAQDERDRLKRVVLAVAQQPETDKAVMNLYLGVVREFVSHHNEYIILDTKVVASADGFEALCKQKANGKLPHGIVASTFENLRPAGDDVEMRIHARLNDCENGALVWEAVAENDYDSQDDDLEKTIANYANRYGAETRPYVAGFYLIVRKLFDSLPQPQLNDDDIEEKIEMDAIAAEWLERLLFLTF